MKRIVSLFLALALMCTMLHLDVHATETSQTAAKLVALTFDDGPHATYTPRLLDGLRERGVVVTFFVLGQNARSNQDIIRRAFNEGHEIACHSWDHPDLTELTTAQILDQFQRSFEVLDAACGGDGHYLVRPPYGSINDTVRQTLSSPFVLWSVDPEDWRYRDAETVRRNIVNYAQDGDIILAHDIYSTTVEGVLMAIDDMLAQGYEFVTVSELHRRRGESLENGLRYYRCQPNDTDLPTLEQPVINCQTHRGFVEVTLSAEAPIYYTTDGSQPTAHSSVYSGPFRVPYDAQINAVAAYNINGSRSVGTSWKMDQIPCQLPSISVVDGLLTLTCGSSNAQLFYTLDGTPATQDSSLYTQPVELSGDCQLRVFAGGSNFRPSREVRAYCTQRWNLFADVSAQDWYFEAMDQLAQLGILQGVASYYYAPGGTITRGQLLTMLYRYDANWLHDAWTDSHSFTDVSSEEYFAEPVEWAYRNGIVQGDSDTSFRPDDPVTREELCQIIDRFLAYRGHPLSESQAPAQPFADQSQVSDWAEAAVVNMAAAGLLQGDEAHRIRPQGTTTRAEAATILTRIIHYESEL